MYPTSLNDIDESYISDLIEQKVPESMVLEYKKELPGNSERDKSEFLADVSSFANTLGGNIIYGLEGEKDEEGKSTGVASNIVGLAAFNADDTRLRLSSILNAGLDPRIPSFHFAELRCQDGKTLFVLHVGRSLAAPHRVCFSGRSHFYVRGAAGKDLMNTYQIRTSMLGSEELPRRVHEFRQVRLGRIPHEEMEVGSLVSKPKVVVHLVPLAAFSGYGTAHSVILHLDDWRNMPTMEECFGGGRRYSTPRWVLDGLLFHNTPGEGRDCYSYSRVYTNGTIEAVSCWLIDEPEKGRAAVTLKIFDQTVFSFVSRCLEHLERRGIEYPIFVSCAVLGAKGMSFEIARDQIRHWPSPEFHHDILDLSGVLLQSRGEDLGKALIPMFDAMWRAGGFDRCHTFDAGPAV